MRTSIQEKNQELETFYSEVEESGSIMSKAELEKKLVEAQGKYQ